MSLPPTLGIARTPTPIEPLERMSERLGGPPIFVKRDDLTGLALSGNKIRKLDYLVAEALAEGADTIVTCGSAQSNHCRATAVLAARRGLQSLLVLKGPAPEAGAPAGNLFLDQLVGATIVWVSADEYRSIDDVYGALAAELEKAGHKAYFVPEGGSNALGALGYVRAVEEIPAGRFTHLVHAVGSGGTTAGLALGSALHGHDHQILGFAVCDDQDFFVDRIGRIVGQARERFDLPEAAPFRILDRYRKTKPEQANLIAQVARAEGLFLDPVYTGKAFFGMAKEIKAGRIGKDARVLFLHTGGLFGLLAASQEFAGLL